MTCMPGSYLGTGQVCVTCEAGYACPGDGTRSPCEPGTYAPTTGLTSCTPCAAGSYAGATGATICTECTAGGYYCPGTGDTAPTVCAAGSSTDTDGAAGATTCAVCPGSCNTGGLGVCATGTTACAGGAWVCNANVASSAEICDGLDNDCDGSMDDGAGSTCASGSCQNGACVCWSDMGGTLQWVGRSATGTMAMYTLNGWGGFYNVYTPNVFRTYTAAMPGLVQLWECQNANSLAWGIAAGACGGGTAPGYYSIGWVAQPVSGACPCGSQKLTHMFENLYQKTYLATDAELAALLASNTPNPGDPHWIAVAPYCVF